MGRQVYIHLKVNSSTSLSLQKPKTEYIGMACNRQQLLPFIQPSITEMALVGISSSNPPKNPWRSEPQPRIAGMEEYIYNESQSFLPSSRYGIGSPHISSGRSNMKSNPFIVHGNIYSRITFHIFPKSFLPTLFFLAGQPPSPFCSAAHGEFVLF